MSRQTRIGTQMGLVLISARVENLVCMIYHSFDRQYSKRHQLRARNSGAHDQFAKTEAEDTMRTGHDCRKMQVRSRNDLLNLKCFQISVSA